MAMMEKENDLSISRQLEEVEGTQWGKAGPGGAYWRNSALTGQGFFDKMVNGIICQFYFTLNLGMELINRSKKARYSNKKK